MRVDTGRLRVVGGEALTPADAADGAPPSPGAYIREHRERRGMSLEELAEATKVPRESLQHVEADAFESLPGTVFAKGFLRCCARVLELDEDTVLGLYYELERRGPAPRGKSEPRAKSEASRRASKPKRPPVEAIPDRGSNEEAPPTPAEASGPEASASTAERLVDFGERAVARVRGLRELPKLQFPPWLEGLRDRVTAPRLLLWVLVTLFVVLIVYLAFTIASGQRGGDIRL